MLSPWVRWGEPSHSTCPEALHYFSTCSSMYSLLTLESTPGPLTGKQYTRLMPTHKGPGPIFYTQLKVEVLILSLILGMNWTEKQAGNHRQKLGHTEKSLYNSAAIQVMLISGLVLVIYVKEARERIYWVLPCTWSTGLNPQTPYDAPAPPGVSPKNWTRSQLGAESSIAECSQK